MPMTWGVRHPVILLPADADMWSGDRRRDVLLHELAHVKRHDFLTQLVARVACAIYWFHPLVWLAARRLRVEREHACDDHVIRSGCQASEYAGHLLEIARSLTTPPAGAFAAVTMARRSQLATRLLDVLDANRARDGVPPRATVGAWLALAAVVLPLAAASPHRPPAPPPLAPGHEGTPRGPTGEALEAATGGELPLDTLRECTGHGSKRSTGTSSNIVEHGTTARTTVRTRVGRCEVLLQAEGRFTFTEDFTDIATVAEGGEVLVETDDRVHERRLVVRQGGGGLEREHTIDRAARPFDADARAWLAETLTFLLRRSGLHADARAEWILSRRGMSGLIEEIAQLEGGSARRHYYGVAVASGRLDTAEFERLVTRAGQEIESDHELAELLIDVARRQPLTPAMQAGFVAAARTIESDYERRRVLDAALARPGLSADVAAGILELASVINSDFELAELLVAVARARRIDDSLRAAFIAAVETIKSDHERDRVLRVLERSGRAELP